MDHDLVLKLNEITILMVIGSVGIVALMGMLVHLSITTIFSGESKLTATKGQ
jgi:hypothetical protein